MDLTGKRVFNLARLGLTPREIEITLGLPPYHIHETYHRELMAGYLKAKSIKDDSGKSKQEKANEYARLYYEARKEKISEQRKRRYYARRKMLEKKDD